MGEKNTITEYIGNGVVRRKPCDISEFTLATPDPSLHAKAMYLLHTFQAVMGLTLHGKALKAYTQANLLHFMKLAQRFDRWTFQGLRIHSADYMLAHKWYYGKKVYVTQLLSMRSFEIYESYKRMKQVRHVTYSAQHYAQYDEGMLETLAVFQEESAEDMEELLALCGLR